MRLAALIVSAALVAIGSVGCGGGGGTPPAPVFSVSSTSWTDGGTIAVRYASTLYAGGGNVSPALEISNVPADAVYLSIVMDDETLPCLTGTGACRHWAVVNFPASKTSIAEAEDLTLVPGYTGFLGGNFRDLEGYEGPNPPGTHTYKLTVYAHKTQSVLSAFPTAGATPYPAITRADFVLERGSDIVASATWTGTFTP